MKIGLILLIDDISASSYSKARDRAIYAEEAGFDSLWIYDHPFRHDSGDVNIGTWECWTFLSALAEATRRIELGSLVLCTQFRNPALLAKMAVTLDEVSNGRFILGLGAGWNKPEFEALGVPYDHRVSRFEEALQIITTLLRAGKIDFNGRYYQVRNCEIKPRGSRLSGPPVLVGGDRPRMLRLAAQYADSWNTGYLNEPPSLVESLAELTFACEQVGRDFSTMEITAIVALHYPDLGNAVPLTPPETYLTGSTEGIAHVLYQYERLGVKHLMFYYMPYEFTTLARLAEAVKLYRKIRVQDQ